MKDKKKVAPDKIVDGALKSWKNLNEFLLEANEESCTYTLNKELRGKNRIMFVLRIHSRINRLRATRERFSLRKMVRNQKE